MIPESWPRAVAHVDADAFYASCERLRNPRLLSRPVCVLSKQDAFVIAKSYEAKALGVETGMPVGQARKLAPDAVFISPDFRFYGQVSRRMFSILRRFSPEVEAYSIDEGFVDLTGLCSLWRKGYRQLAEAMREAVLREIGLSVSVGVAPTKVLAKMASKINKPGGCAVVPGGRIRRFLQPLPVEAIPGIGKKRAHLLRRFGIATALAFAQTSPSLVRRLLGRHGLNLWHELRGRSVFRFASVQPKSIARTASLGCITADRSLLSAHLARHGMRLIAELTDKKLLARRLTVFLTLESFERVAAEYRFPEGCDSLAGIFNGVRSCFSAIYREGCFYRGCGLIATHLLPRTAAAGDLFRREEERRRQLSLAIHDIQHRFGKDAVMPAATLRIQGRMETLRFRYPLLHAQA